MKLFGFDISRAESRAAPISGTVSPSDPRFLEFFGITQTAPPPATLENAMKVPAFSGAVGFLSLSMAGLPKHLYKVDGENAVKAGGPLQRIINEAPNPEWAAFPFWRYFWQQVFTAGRGLAWIERNGTQVVGLWPMDPAKTSVSMVRGRKYYKYQGQPEPYLAADVIDVPFMLRADQVNVYSPLTVCGRAVQLALAMNDYASGYFAGGGVTPLALVGPPATGADAMERAVQQVKQSIDVARKANIPIAQLPPGYELKPIGYEPEKGQLLEAQLFQVQEISRPFGLPPVFLQDLSKGTMANVEQQDLSLVKHCLTHWAQAGEDELNLKLFGAKRNNRYVEHAMDGVMRGDLKTRMEALARAIQTGQLMPDEARALENRAPLPGGVGAVPYVQGATVPLGSQVQSSKPTEGNGDQTDDDGTQGAH